MNRFVEGVVVMAVIVAILSLCYGLFLGVKSENAESFEKNGWMEVGKTPRGVTIHKKWFPEEKAWIYAAYTHETISVVPETRTSEKAEAPPSKGK